uniref:F-box domain-containing protein n=1 Tax=Panagrellus redivivus TaxID=6233 RepID=A0A7E4W3X1_PANRE
MTTKNPTLKPHLIREILKILGPCENGDVLGRLGLSGKEAFFVFVHFIEEHAVFDFHEDTAIPIRVDPSCFQPPIMLRDYDKSNWFLGFLSFLRFYTLGSWCLVARYVRKFKVELNLFLPNIVVTGNLTELTLTGEFSESIAPLINFWSSLEVLKLDSDYADKFVDDVESGDIRLDNLQYLKIKMSLRKFYDLLSDIKFPFPEDVKIDLVYANCVMADFIPSNTFPQVKYVSFDIKFRDDINYDLVNRLPAIVGCFPAIEVAKIEIIYHHDSSPDDHSRILDFHDWLSKADFAVPVEITHHESVELSVDDNAEAIYEHLKSMGFKEDYDRSDFIFKKVYSTVRLIHHLSHRETFSGSDLGIYSSDEELGDGDGENDV